MLMGLGLWGVTAVWGISLLLPFSFLSNQRQGRPFLYYLGIFSPHFVFHLRLKWEK